MKIEIGKEINIPEGYEAVEYGILRAGDTYLGYDGKEIYTGPSSYTGHSSVCRLKLRRKLYAPIPEGYVEDGWIEANTPEPLGTLYLHPSDGVCCASGSNTVSSRPRLRLKKKTRTATVLTARVVLPEGHQRAYPMCTIGVYSVDANKQNLRDNPIRLVETTEEVPA